MRVAVLGAGVAGLTAAHELVERGVEVEVYERLDAAGGKARSVAVAWEGGAYTLPGEHGFRYFPGFYRHVIDTMRRIPCGSGTVLDHLTDAHESMFAEAGYAPIETPAMGPTSLHDVLEGLKALKAIEHAVTKPELHLFGQKLWQAMTSCSARRFAEYENQSWSTFLEAREQNEAYNTWFAGGITRTLVAASGERASARTVGDITVQLFATSWRPGYPSDRLLDGPTSDVWIDPWLRYLESTGRFSIHYGQTVRSLVIEKQSSDRHSIAGVELEDSGGRRGKVVADAYVAAMPVEVLASLVSDDLARVAPTLGMARSLASHVRWMAGIQIYLRKDTRIVAGHSIYVGAPWGLTSVSQQQFWPHLNLAKRSGGAVQGVLSVDISDWDSKGFNGKTAKECSREEICEEVLEQLRRCLGETPGVDLSPENIAGFFIDPDIIFFSDGGPPERNYEPLLVNELGSWWIRPNAYTEIPSLYLAGDFVRNNTDLATMEGANEAARRAVNALVADRGIDAPLCRLWDLHEPELLAPFRWIDSLRFSRGKPWSPGFPAPLVWLARAATRAAGRLPGGSRRTGHPR
jgi:uncharacterized protein with NAD-binding domain and iron-sulfur cluster